MLLGLLGYEGYQRFKNTLMGTGSQGKNWRQNNDPQMTGIVPASQPENLPPLLHKWNYYQHFLSLWILQ